VPHQVGLFFFCPCRNVIATLHQIEFIRRTLTMLWTIAIILVILWLVGFMTANTFGGLIYLLLVIALVMIVLQLVSGRRAHTA
jgi:hypothetical protein